MSYLIWYYEKEKTNSKQLAKSKREEKSMSIKFVILKFYQKGKQRIKYANVLFYLKVSVHPLTYYMRI